VSRAVLGDAVTTAAYCGVVSIAPVEQESVSTSEEADLDVPWITLVWNDPVNLMSYVTYVFQTYFGYSRTKAEKLMMDVHVKGRAVVSTGAREKMEADTEALQGYGLWATFQKDS
jgi:ATP-dependent Clp protease adaptor protein ClpS